jgi:hypothetical protein
MLTQYLDHCAVVDPMNGESHRIGTIGRYEVILADGPRRRSAFEIKAGDRANTSVWLMQGPVYCCWQGTVERIIADPSSASGFLSDAECTELAAMVAATRITSKVATALDGFRKLCERLRPRAGDLEVEQLTHDERTRLVLDLLATARALLDVLRSAGHDVDDAAESLQVLAEAGQALADEPAADECPGCGALQGEGTTPGCEHPDGCGLVI